jgi:hypothetical protein
MKFLCMECDEAMSLESTDGPERGSMSVVFGCPSCGRKIAMLTNAMETQVVRSLGVKIGGRTVPSEPMEMVRGSLVNRRQKISDTLGPVETSPQNVELEESKCPFTGMVNDAFDNKASIQWSDAARRRMERIPDFARQMVMKGVEDAAREQGLHEVTESVLDDVRGRLGM